MERYLRDNKFLNHYSKIKNKFIYEHLQRSLVKHESDKEK